MQLRLQDRKEEKPSVDANRAADDGNEGLDCFLILCKRFIRFIQRFLNK